MSVKYTPKQIDAIRDALTEALEGAIHFDDMEDDCPHCKFVNALYILDNQGRWTAETELSDLL